MVSGIPTKRSALVERTFAKMASRLAEASGLEPGSPELIALLKLSNQRYQQTVIVVTHDRNIALQADRIITFGDGRIVSDEAARA